MCIDEKRREAPSVPGLVSENEAELMVAARADALSALGIPFQQKYQPLTAFLQIIADLCKV